MNQHPAARDTGAPDPGAQRAACGSDDTRCGRRACLTATLGRTSADWGGGRGLADSAAGAAEATWMTAAFQTATSRRGGLGSNPAGELPTGVLLGAGHASSRLHWRCGLNATAATTTWVANASKSHALAYGLLAYCTVRCRMPRIAVVQAGLSTHCPTTPFHSSPRLLTHNESRIGTVRRVRALASSPHARQPGPRKHLGRGHPLQRLRRLGAGICLVPLDPLAAGALASRPWREVAVEHPLSGSPCHGVLVPGPPLPARPRSGHD